MPELTSPDDLTWIGTIKPGGQRGTPDIEITFNANATTNAVQNTMRRISFFTTTDIGTSRVVEFHLSGEGVESNTATREISVIDPDA